MISIVKTIRIPNVRSFSRSLRKKDPGIRLRKKVLGSREEMDDDDFDDPESDFMGVHKTHREHVEGMKEMLEKEKFHIVKQKYFKEKYPNFLTWNDKEQIKYLHSTDPEEWTVDRLAEGFPALPDVVMKIVKSKWTKDPRKVKNHDLSVQNNWEMFKTGQIPNLPRELVQHLNKFTNRALNLTPFPIPDKKKVVEIRNKTKNTEFSDIISSYEKLTSKNKELAVKENSQVNVNLTLKPAADTDTYLTVDKNSIRKRRPITLQELQSKIESRANRGKKLSVDDKLIMKGLEKRPEENIEIKENKLVDIEKNKYESGGALAVKSTRNYAHLVYPEKIMIPTDLKKKGHTYKLNDCYYDDDGRFLYRVPGMV